MDKSNTSFGMLATHVNDLRRLWFLEHKKNQKLKSKLQKLKGIIKDIQNQINYNESDVIDFNFSLNNRLSFSNQSTLENTINLRYNHRKLLSCIEKIVSDKIKVSFESLKNLRNQKNNCNNERNLKNPKQNYYENSINSQWNVVKSADVLRIFNEKLYGSLHFICLRLKRKVFSCIVSRSKKIFKKLSKFVKIIIKKKKQKIILSFKLVQKYGKIYSGMIHFKSVIDASLKRKKNMVLGLLSLNYEDSIFIHQGINTLVCILDKIKTKADKKSIFQLIKNAQKRKMNPSKKSSGVRILKNLLNKKITRVVFDIKIASCNISNSNQINSSRNHKGIHQIKTLLNSYQKYMKLTTFYKLKSLKYTHAITHSRNLTNASIDSYQNTPESTEFICNLHKFLLFQHRYQSRLIRESFLIILKSACHSLSMQSLQTEKLRSILYKKASFSLITQTKIFLKWKNAQKKLFHRKFNPNSIKILNKTI